MIYQLAPVARKFEPFVWWEGAFNEQELDYLQNLAKNSTDRAQVGSQEVNDTEGLLNKIRRSNVSWLNHEDPESLWVFERLGEVASQMNAEHYQLDLTGFGEGMQLTNYNGSEQGMYGWHQDYNSSLSRKLSIVLQLSDPADYEGGNLQVKTGLEDFNVRKQRGLVAIFPSYTVHQVTPVVQGTRQSLVAWISGPQFK